MKNHVNHSAVLMMRCKIPSHQRMIFRLGSLMSKRRMMKPNSRAAVHVHPQHASRQYGGRQSAKQLATL
ncbi:hypothetical protein O3P69_019881 [Scylla paramamosain]|uniref:Uncharacterized protein n=1 Tax=Scylla paramamosain TaxID=85552 RepID=A0AAW0SC59_SCYPA